MRDGPLLNSGQVGPQATVVAAHELIYGGVRTSCIPVLANHPTSMHTRCRGCCALTRVLIRQVAGQRPLFILVDGGADARDQVIHGFHRPARRAMAARHVRLRSSRRTSAPMLRR